MFHLVSSDDLSLLKHLHGVKFSIVNLLHKHHFPVRPFSNHRHRFKVFLADAARFFLLIGNDIGVLLFDLFFTFHELAILLHGLVLVRLFVNFHLVLN